MSIETYIKERNIPARHAAPLAGMTTLHVGGPARVLAMPRTVEQLVDAVHGARMEGLPLRLLGGGSNLLIPDEGINGVVLRTRGLRRRRFFDNGVEAEGGVGFPLLVRESVDRGLAGIEALCGIPGTVAGALAMNAGGRHGEVERAVEWVDVLEPDGTLRRLSRSDVTFGYRTSSLKGSIVLGCRFRLSPGDPDAIERRYREVLNAKQATQPLGERTAGCMFRNPQGGSAGRLIDQAGLKNARVGEARISQIHANFIVNEGRATAKDIRLLAEHVREHVRDRFGVKLEFEVVRW